MFMLFMIQPFDLALKVHQTDAFNFKMCKTFFSRGSMPPNILWEALNTYCTL